MASALSACVLAAGKGTRMGGDRPKVLFEAGGKPLIEWVLSALSATGIDDIVAVVGFGKDEVVSALPTGVRWVEQSPQLGTGHAVLCARNAFQDINSPIVVTCGDMPLLTAESFRAVTELREKENAACAMLSVRIPTESRFGRVIRDEGGHVLRIVEYKDALDEEKIVTEGNTGVYCFRPDLLWDALNKVGNNNAQGEYYLTDVIALLIEKGETVLAHICADDNEALGVNTPEDLKTVESCLLGKK